MNSSLVAGAGVSAYATGRTLTVLPGLDAERKGAIMRFVQRSQLINKGHPVVALDGADLSEVDLSNIDLSNTDLSGALIANANLSHANLNETDLSGVNLKDANLKGANLERATMPDGQKYEEWLESKGSGEDGENAGTS